MAKTAVLNLIEQSKIGLAHTDIQQALGALCNRVTIYRVLDRLVIEDKIHKVVDTDGVAKFLACNHCHETHDHQHLHFSCINCGNVTCLYNVVPKFNLPALYTINEVNFTVSGVCNKCNSL